MKVDEGVNTNNGPVNADDSADDAEDTDDMDMEDAKPSNTTVILDLEHDSTFCVPVAVLVDERERSFHCNPFGANSSVVEAIAGKAFLQKRLCIHLYNNCCH